ncbi:NADH-ubiquinone oxidoreductase [Smittium culicis]|uniref:NADH-ubiquinone oxidoreductase n=1 Tax=Smittium culicis TaxID=133412 RepID=A0A1R1YNP7_9FUNG|nr:NADH-ubiquinone oxidoreductase [Smittium culicis]
MTIQNDWATEAAKYTMIGGGLGLLTSAFQNAIQSHQSGAMGVFTRTGSTIGFLAVMGGVFAGTRGLSANIRQEDDYWNTAYAGCAAGLIAGMRKKSLPTSIGACVFMGGSLATYDYLGGLQPKITELAPDERQKYRESLLPPSNHN